jgi:RNA polymerase sigma factor (sigma-70 family)
MVRKQQVDLRISEKESVDVVDLLVCRPSKEPFLIRVGNLNLNTELEQKIRNVCDTDRGAISPQLSVKEEKELATEVLLLRHKFTELVWKTKPFSQAALTIIQNIYLFRNRKIFFDPSGALYEQERQEALYLFSSTNSTSTLPLAKTFQHLIIARVWARIRCQSCEKDFLSPAMEQLNKIVEDLNTIRNIYVLLTTGLVKKIVTQIGEIYKEGLTHEDATQIGSFGIARAAYRYHHSCGVRFSTYAANWIKKEIQRQSLDGRLIRVSTNTIEQYALAQKNNDNEQLRYYQTVLTNADCRQESSLTDMGEERLKKYGETMSEPERLLINKEHRQMIHRAIDSLLSKRDADFIKRRFGLGPYSATPQSIIAISKTYGVTRSAMYQQEKKILKDLRRALLEAAPC